MEAGQDQNWGCSAKGKKKRTQYKGNSLYLVPELQYCCFLYNN
jgi:hypothetical protein